MHSAGAARGHAGMTRVHGAGPARVRSPRPHGARPGLASAGAMVGTTARSGRRHGRRSGRDDGAVDEAVGTTMRSARRRSRRQRRARGRALSGGERRGRGGCRDARRAVLTAALSHGVGTVRCRAGPALRAASDRWGPLVSDFQINNFLERK
jgi:hypothetical protein